MQPPMHTGLKVLSKELFIINKKIGALIVPVKSCKRAMELRPFGLLQLARFPTILSLPSKANGNEFKRMVLLDLDVDFTSIDTLPPKISQFAKEVGAEITTYTLDFDFDYWTSEQILKSILPSNLDVPSSFATVGHIAHFNLRKEYDDYKKIIGEVILAKARNIKTVVNKVDNIDNTFRFFKMELLAGEDNLIAVQKEGNCTYKFDFSKVYWNSRLQGEHERLVNNFQKGDIICDVFGGIGPFALPAAKNRKCFVFVNDLNPDSYKYLNENISLNKTADKVSSYNMDGREFIANSLNLVGDSKVWAKFKEVQIQYSKLRRNSDRKVEDQPGFPLDNNFIPDHYIMNLPATAIDFLDAFIGLFKNSNVEKLPMIHCYCFASKNEPEIEITQRVTHKIGAVKLNIRHVRNVAPNKDMYCVSFRLPASIAYKNELKRKSDKEI